LEPLKRSFNLSLATVEFEERNLSLATVEFEERNLSLATVEFEERNLSLATKGTAFFLKRKELLPHTAIIREGSNSPFPSETA